MKPTQLLVMFAIMIAHVAIFENKRRTGGSLLLSTGESDFPAWINRSSDMLIELLSCGSFVTRDAQIVSHSSPRDEKRMKGPDNPTVDIARGVSNKPITFPR